MGYSNGGGSSSELLESSEDLSDVSSLRGRGRLRS
jgi:hypothetical protein